MALARTTLSSACTQIDKSIVVASATSLAAGRLVRIDDEMMQIAQDYVSGTTANVLRGRDGSAQVAHVASAGVVHGLASDFDNAPVQTAVSYPAPRVRQVVSITATGTLTLPPAGQDLMVILNGTSVITLTVPVPTVDMDGCELSIVGNGAAAHVLTFTGGLSGAGGSYDVVTVNATAPIAFKVVACNALWTAYAQIPIAGTVTNVTGTIS
jgi:hypothetical protein